MNAKIVEIVGTLKLKIYHMESIKKFPRGILNQVISKAGSAYGGPQRAPDSGLKLKQHASTLKLDHSHSGLPRVVKASSSKEPQASGSKLQAPSTLEQASSHKRQAP